jgi:hypothetical protein
MFSPPPRWFLQWYMSMYLHSWLLFKKNPHTCVRCNSFSAHVNSISCREEMVCFVVLLLKSAEIYMKAFWHGTNASRGTRGSDGTNGNEVHIRCWKNISIWAKVTQVSDVAHGPLVAVTLIFPSSEFDFSFQWIWFFLSVSLIFPFSEVYYLAKASFLQDMLLGMFVCCFLVFFLSCKS